MPAGFMIGQTAVGTINVTPPNETSTLVVAVDPDVVLDTGFKDRTNPNGLDLFF